jgi:hypothetical protein
MACVRFWPVYSRVVGSGLIVVLGCLVLAVLTALREEQSVLLVLSRVILEAFNPVVRCLTIALAGAWCLGSAWRAAGSITRERELHTLDGLLTLPTDHRIILGAKWLGSILRFRWLGYCLVAVWTVGLICGALHPVGGLLLALACAAHIAFLASLGVWLSLVSRNTLWANLGMAMIVLVVFVGPWALQAYSQLLLGIGLGGWLDDFVEVALNPPRAWWFLAFTWEEFNNGIYAANGPSRGTLGAVLAGIAVYAVAAATLWLGAAERLHIESETRNR